ncbi:MAG: GDSL-type esterase/lipase family protein [Planctomycetaceae bacterium]|jgi:beta-glucosidase|nr:GDSL-type esterase/lipase family protein [Planctomycetaceae bacterium]
MNTRLISRFLLCAAAALVLVSALQAENKALIPVDKKDGGWVKRHAAQVEQMSKGSIELLLIGDSITHGWDSHKDLYDKYFGPYKPINLGISGDQTQHVLWRLDHLPLDKINPKVAQIMIGTNNIGGNTSTPAETVAGIKAVVVKLQKQYPKLQIIVLKVFPRDEKPDGERRQRVDAINKELPAALKGLKNVELVDINAGFLDKNGTLPKSIMPDFLHPNREGDDYWGKTVEPIIKAKFQTYGKERPIRGERLRRFLNRLR